MTTATIKDMAAKLKESGLQAADAKTLGCRFIEKEAAAKLYPKAPKLGAIEIPYYGADGKKTKYSRWRYLDEPRGFAKLAGRFHKYTQIPGSGTRAYFPPTIKGATWADIIDDPGYPIHITEGEFKSACACKFGFPTIGLGGVYGWIAAKKGITFLDDLEQIKWKERLVYLAFDSDLSTNPDVQKALARLAHQITKRGGRPLVVFLPNEKDGSKNGLDDYLVRYKAPAYKNLVEGAEPYSEANALWDLNAEVAYVKDQDVVVELETARRIQPATFVGSAYSNRYYREKQVDKDGDSRWKDVRSARPWLNWPHRLELEGIIYEPGSPQITAENKFNSWPGWAATPVKGNVKPWHDLLDYIFQKQPESRIYFEQWLAYQLQYPGTKLIVAAVLWGILNGTGKSLVGYTMKRIYGDNFEEIGDDDLTADYNEWAAEKQFIMGEEITGSDSRKLRGKIYSMMSRQKIRINEKFLPKYSTPDRTNYYFTSNQPDAFLLDDTDRRFFVIEMPDKPADDEFYEAYDLWYKSEAGINALFYYLLHVNVTDFNPYQGAPMTEAKASMILASKSDLGTWVRDMLTHPDEHLVVGGVEMQGDLVTAKQMLFLFDPEQRTKVTANGMAREMKRAGAAYVHGGRTIATKTEGHVRLYAVRNRDAWKKADHSTIAEHFDKYRIKRSMDKC